MEIGSEFDKNRVPKRYQDEAALIHAGLYIVWNTKFERWQIRFKDPRTGLDQHVISVEDDDGNYEHLNMGVLRMLKDTVCWDLIWEYPEPKDRYKAIMKEHQLRKERASIERFQFLKDFNRDHRTEWRAALENAKRGVWGRPEIREKKIIIT